MNFLILRVETENLLVHKFLNFSDRKLKTNPLLDDVVKVLSPTFEDFYRAKILNIGNNGDILVFYIDFGNTEVVQSNNIFELSDDLKLKVIFNYI